MSSLDIQELVDLPAASLAQALLAFPGTRSTHPAEPTWWDWRARWGSGSDFVEFDFSLFDNGGENWGGSRIAADCPSSIVLSLLHHLNQLHPGVWLHDPDCGMHAYPHLAIVE